MVCCELRVRWIVGASAGLRIRSDLDKSLGYFVCSYV
jgi:hypothetical protein